MKKALFTILMIALLITVLTSCSTEYKVLNQSLYSATVVGPDPDYPEVVEVLIQPNEVNKEGNMMPPNKMYYELGDSTSVNNLQRGSTVYVLVSEYLKNDMGSESIEYSIDGLFKTKEEADKSFPIVEKVVPTKVIRKYVKEGLNQVVLSLEEEHNKVTNIYVFSTSSNEYDRIKEKSYYNMLVQIKGTNIKVKSVTEEIDKLVYDNYMKEQFELKNAF